MKEQIAKILHVMLNVNIISVEVFEKDDLCVWVAGESVGLTVVPSKTGAINLYKLAQESKNFISHYVDLIQSGMSSNVDGAFCTVVTRVCEAEPVIFNEKTEIEAIFSACAYVADQISGTTGEQAIINDVESFDKEFESDKRAIVNLLKTENFIAGEYSRLDDVIPALFKKDEPKAVKTLLLIYQEIKTDKKMLENLLIAISRLETSLFYEEGFDIAKESLSNEYIEIKDAALRVFENYHSDPRTLELLTNVNFGIFWLDEYKEDIIKNIHQQNELKQ